MNKEHISQRLILYYISDVFCRQLPRLALSIFVINEVHTDL